MNLHSSHDYEDYFDASLIDTSTFAQHPSELPAEAPQVPEDAVLSLVRISAVGNSTDESQRSYSVYYLEVRCNRLEQVWFVYRRYSQFRRLSDALRSEGYYVPVLPPKQQSQAEFKLDSIRKRKFELEAWVKSLSEQSTLHVGAKDPQTNIYYRQFLLEDANIPPPSLVRVFPESLAIRASTDMRKSTQQPYVKVNVDDFEILRIIGKGSFGKVSLVKKKSDGKLYAMKVLNKSNVIKRRQVEHTNTERRVLGTINHPFIVKLYYAFQTEDKLHFVLDYCAGGELFFHLSRLKKFPESMARFYCAEIILALETLHDHNIVYRDLKPENVLLDGDGHVKLADFGLAKENVSEATEGAHSLCGTPEYLSPEVLNRQGHGVSVDWWNLGMVTYEMLTGLPPWYTTDREKLFDRIRGAPLKFPFYVSRPAASLISKLLNRNPAERLGSNGSWQVTQHPFFSTIDWDALLNKEIQPPLDPCRNSDEIDSANFEKEFTNMPISIDEGRGKNADSGKEKVVGDVGDKETFLNFTYEENSAFEGLRSERRK